MSSHGDTVDRITSGSRCRLPIDADDPPLRGAGPRAPAERRGCRLGSSLRRPGSDSRRGAGGARARRQSDGDVRGHGWAVACGIPLPTLFAEILGRASGTNGGRGGSAYLSSPEHRFLGENSIVGAGLPIANGVGLAAQLSGSGRVVVVSFGDGATSQGATHEALVMAVARKLPVVFVCENNDWSEMTPIAAIAPLRDLADRAPAYGLPGETVDGTDPVEGGGRDRRCRRARAGWRRPDLPRMQDGAPDGALPRRRRALPRSSRTGVPRSSVTRCRACGSGCSKTGSRTRGRSQSSKTPSRPRCWRRRSRLSQSRCPTRRPRRLMSASRPDPRPLHGPRRRTLRR